MKKLLDLRSVKDQKDLKSLFKDISLNVPTIQYKKHICSFFPMVTSKYEYMGLIQCSSCYKSKSMGLKRVKETYPNFVIYQSWKAYCKENNIKTFQPKRYNVPLSYMKNTIEHQYNMLYWNTVEFNNSLKHNRS